MTKYTLMMILVNAKGWAAVELASLNPKKEITFFDRNETATLSKIGINEENVHLSCQIELNEHIDGLEIEILFA